MSGREDQLQDLSEEISAAIAREQSMPGLDHHQRRYVRYSDEPHAVESPDGWLRDKHRLHLERSRNPTLAVPRQAVPQQVQLKIKSAPAELRLPVKSDRRFKPEFKVEVIIWHNGELDMPLRVKAFAVDQHSMRSIEMWKPHELRDDVPTATPAHLEMKGNVVVSQVFQTSAMPQSPKQAGRLHQQQPLASNSIVSSADDPSMASVSSFGNAFVATMEFHDLEFVRATRMTPVYLVFACLIANRDLLFVTYNFPTICICRAQQRENALLRLGLKPTVWQQVAAHGGRVPDVISRKHNPSNSSDNAGSMLAAIAPLPPSGASGTSTPPSSVSQVAIPGLAPFRSLVASAEHTSATPVSVVALGPPGPMHVQTSENLVASCLPQPPRGPGPMTPTVPETSAAVAREAMVVASPSHSTTPMNREREQEAERLHRHHHARMDADPPQGDVGRSTPERSGCSGSAPALVHNYIDAFLRPSEPVRRVSTNSEGSDREKADRLLFLRLHDSSDAVSKGSSGACGRSSAMEPTGLRASSAMADQSASHPVGVSSGLLDAVKLEPEDALSALNAAAGGDQNALSTWVAMQGTAGLAGFMGLPGLSQVLPRLDVLGAAGAARDGEAGAGPGTARMDGDAEREAAEMLLALHRGTQEKEERTGLGSTADAAALSAALSAVGVGGRGGGVSQAMAALDDRAGAVAEDMGGAGASRKRSRDDYGLATGAKTSQVADVLQVLRRMAPRVGKSGGLAALHPGEAPGGLGSGGAKHGAEGHTPAMGAGGDAAAVDPKQFMQPVLDRPQSAGNTYQGRGADEVPVCSQGTASTAPGALPQLSNSQQGLQLLNLLVNANATTRRPAADPSIRQGSVLPWLMSHHECVTAGGNVAASVPESSSSCQFATGAQAQSQQAASVPPAALHASSGASSISAIASSGTSAGLGSAAVNLQSLAGARESTFDAALLSQIIAGCSRDGLGTMPWLQQPRQMQALVGDAGTSNGALTATTAAAPVPQSTGRAPLDTSLQIAQLQSLLQQTQARQVFSQQQQAQALQQLASNPEAMQRLARSLPGDLGGAGVGV